jgi:hypothetical protein
MTYAILVGLRRLERNRAVESIALTALVAAVFCSMSPQPYYAPYFVATGGTLLLILLTKLPFRLSAVVLGTAAVVFVILWPTSLVHPEPTTLFTDHASEINRATANEPALGMLGPYGYQADYYLSIHLVRDRDQALAAGASHFFTMSSSRMNDADRKFISENLALVAKWDDAEFYVVKGLAH